MISRSQWKAMRRSEGMPEGKKAECRCGGLIILETNAEHVILHHSQPHCALFDRLFARAEFHTLSATSPEEVQAALDQARKRPGAP